MTHKFKIGETVFLKPSHTQSLRGGVYIVIKRLPGCHGQFEYRVRNSSSCKSASFAKMN